MMKKISILLSAMLLSGVCFADVNNVKTKLAKNYPNLKIENVQTTEMNGLYSAVMDGQIIYVGDDAEHLFIGSMFRIKDQKNLTQDLSIKQNKVDWKKLPLKDAIKTVRGTGKRQLAIFSDPNCPYCKKLEVELNKLNDVTIYTFIFPIKPQSIAPSKQVFCEKDPALAWTNFISKGIEPSSKKLCDNPIERNINLGKSLGFNGTPVIILENGYRLTGAYPATEIEKIWKEEGL